MKIQLLTAAIVLTLTSGSAFAFGGGHHGGSSGGPDSITNKSANNLAIGGDTLLIGVGYREGEGGAGFLAYNSGGRAVAGSVYLEGDFCACDLGPILNKTRNNIAIGEATAGSVHVNKAMYGYGH